MIARITGKVIEKQGNSVVIDAGGICYEVLVPTVVMQRLDEHINNEGIINFVTYHYLHVEPSRSFPVLIGFTNEVEKEFFEVFITVSGIGPKAALRALNKPISLIAKAIDEADITSLKSLPGIGQQRAKEIVAKLQNKVGKFGLMQDAITVAVQLPTKDIEEEAVAVLVQLEYKRTEAVSMIKKAMERSPEIETTEELLNEVYKHRKIT
jgi:Holliday junction DNA helicase RuvA